MNPVDAARKKEKVKELKRNRDLRKAQREVQLKRMTPEEISEQITKITRLGQQQLCAAHSLFLDLAVLL